MSKNTKIVALFLGVIVLILLSWSRFSFLLNPEARKSSQILTDFLTNISNSQIDKAYELTSAEFQSSITPNELKEQIKKYPANYSGFKSQKGFKFRKKESAELVVYGYAGDILYTDGKSTFFQANLVLEDGRMKVSWISIATHGSRMGIKQEEIAPSLGHPLR